MPILKADATPSQQPRPAPVRELDGTLKFSDFPNFRPNLTPAQVLQVRMAHLIPKRFQDFVL